MSGLARSGMPTPGQPPSIRRRLFGAILAPAVTLMTATLILVFVQVRADRLSDLDQALEARALALVGMAEFGHTGWSAELRLGEASGADLLHNLASWQLRVHPCGEILAQSAIPPHADCAPLESLPESLPEEQARPAQLGGGALTVSENARTLRQFSGVYVARADVDDDEHDERLPAGLVHATVSAELTPLHDGLRRLLAEMLALGVLLILLTVPLARGLARRTAGPIERLAQTMVAQNEPGPDPVVEVSGDYAELDQLRAALNAAFARAHGALERQREFTADASHELRTPLAALRTTCEVTLDHPRAADTYRAVVEKNLNAALRLQHLVEGLMLLARADQAIALLSTERTDLHALAAETIAAIPCELRDRVSLREGAACWADVEPVLLGRALTNLIDNALAYSDGPVQLSVRVENASSSNHIVVVISDEGQGIAEEHVAHIFDRFYRIDKARSRSSGGAGLGLAIVKAIAEAHHGSVAVSSNSGVGSRFVLRIPACRPGGGAQDT